jgi:hypothetical protein
MMKVKKIITAISCFILFCTLYGCLHDDFGNGPFLRNLSNRTIFAAVQHDTILTSTQPLGVILDTLDRHGASCVQSGIYLWKAPKTTKDPEYLWIVEQDTLEKHGWAWVSQHKKGIRFYTFYRSDYYYWDNKDGWSSYQFNYYNDGSIFLFPDSIPLDRPNKDPEEHKPK